MTRTDTVPHSAHVFVGKHRAIPPGCATFKSQKRERPINQWGIMKSNWALEGEKGRNWKQRLEERQHS